MRSFRDLGTVTLETERLILRRFTLADAQGVFEGWTGDEKSAARCTWRVHPNAAYTEEILSHWIDEYEDNAYNWLVESKAARRPIGNISTVRIDRKNGNCEIGYCYGSPFWGRDMPPRRLSVSLIFYLTNVGFTWWRRGTLQAIPQADA